MLKVTQVLNNHLKLIATGSLTIDLISFEQINGDSYKWKLPLFIESTQAQSEEEDDDDDDDDIDVVGLKFPEASFLWGNSFVNEIVGKFCKWLGKDMFYVFVGPTHSGKSTILNNIFLQNYFEVAGDLYSTTGLKTKNSMIYIRHPNIDKLWFMDTPGYFDSGGKAVDDTHYDRIQKALEFKNIPRMLFSSS